MTQEHIDIWVRGKTTKIIADGRVLLILVRKHIPTTIHEEAYPEFRRLARKKPTRVAASGLSAHRFALKDGSPSKTTRIRIPKDSPLYVAKDGTMGSYEDTLHKAEYCRTNEYDVAMLPQVSNYVQLIEQAYRQYAPEHHAAQLAAISEVRSDWQLFPESSISSVTSS
jgi:hypothetical protein